MRRFWRMGENGEEINIHSLPVIKCHGDVYYTIGNIDNNVSIIIYGVRWILDLSGWLICKVYKFLTTMIPESNIIFYVNYN